MTMRVDDHLAKPEMPDLRQGIVRSLDVTRAEMQACSKALAQGGCPAQEDTDSLVGGVGGEVELNALATATRGIAYIESCTDRETGGRRCRPYYLMKDVFFRLARLA